MADGEDIGLDVAVLVAMLRADLGESADFLGHLATLLEGALPDIVRVERRGGLLSAKKVHQIRVELAGVHYSIARQKHGTIAHVHKFVHGVRLSSKETAVEPWIQGLAAELRALAESSASARSALEQLLFATRRP